MRVFDALLGPNQQALVSSTLEDQAQTQREQLRRNFIAAVVNSDRTELPRNELLFHKRGIIEHVATADGDWYIAAGSTGNDPAYLPDAQHYYVTASGDVVLLQPAPGRVTPRSSDGNTEDTHAMMDMHIQFAPLATLERLNDPAWNHADRTLYDSRSLSFLPSRTSVPLLVDRDAARQVGLVRTLYRIEEADGPWLCAAASVTAPPGWLTRGTGASFAFIPVQESSFTQPGDADHIRHLDHRSQHPQPGHEAGGAVREGDAAAARPAAEAPQAGRGTPPVAAACTSRPPRVPRPGRP